MRKTRRVWLGLAAAAVIAIGAGFLGWSIWNRTDPTPGRDDTVVTQPEESEVDKVVEALESLKPGEPAGFDPVSWADAQDTNAILPAGTSVKVIDGSVVVTGTEATADVTVSGSGQPESRSWVFLHKVNDKWLVAGTLPLEGGS